LFLILDYLFSFYFKYFNRKFNTSSINRNIKGYSLKFVQNINKELIGIYKHKRKHFIIGRNFLSQYIKNQEDNLFRISKFEKYYEKLQTQNSPLLILRFI